MAGMDDKKDDGRERMRLLIERTEGRVALEALQKSYSRRLHRQSDDFDATDGLRLVIAKLQRVSYGPPVITRSS